MLVAISGGAGFLGLHLARRLVGDGHAVRILDLARSTTRRCRARRGAVRRASDARRLVAGADVLVHAAAALPIQVTRDAIRSVNVEGTAVTLGAALEAGVRRVVLISSTAVYGVPEAAPDPRGRPARRGRALRVEDRGGAALRRVRPAGPRGRRRPAEDVRRPRAAGCSRSSSWIREGRRIPILGDGSNRYQLLAVEDLVDAVVRCFGLGAGEALNIGAGRFGTVREDLEARRARRLGLAPRPVPARPAELALRGSSWRGSPLAEWHYRTGHKDSSSRSTRRSPSSGGSRGSPTPRRSARRTTGTSRTASSSAPRARRTASRGIQRALGVLRRLS